MGDPLGPAPGGATATRGVRRRPGATSLLSGAGNRTVRLRAGFTPGSAGGSGGGGAAGVTPGQLAGTPG
ncbi:hypothetical protein ACFPM0_02695 [Pseudonocardia sulfidoxydans]|uniref:hypothetical protein n=1 Tax=Pseudonocardia sulfidoxydans TaxID=54011 RepID=UPI00362245E2